LNITKAQFENGRPITAADLKLPHIETTSGQPGGKPNVGGCA